MSKCITIFLIEIISFVEALFSVTSDRIRLRNKGEKSDEIQK